MGNRTGTGTEEVINGMDATQQTFKKNGLGMFQDSFFLSDITEAALGSSRDLVHEQFDKINGAPTPSQAHSISEHLKAEAAFRFEYASRGLSIPKKTSKLATIFDSLSISKTQKAEDEKREATTTPDANDGHVHKISDLDGNGDGTTSSDGDPTHTHNVANFLVLPVEIDGKTSEHPGKVMVKSDANFRVTKRYDNGNYDWESTFNLFKVDEEQRLVGGIVYEPDVVDAQGDSASEFEIRMAAHDYMIKSQVIGHMHKERVPSNDAAIVENFIAPIAFISGNQIVRKGSWVMVQKIFNDQLWKDIKEGRLTGFSMAGRARDEEAQKIGKSETKQVGISGYISILEKGFDLDKVIREVDGQFCIFTEDGGKKLGCHDDRESALNHLRAIEANKNLTPTHLAPETKVAKDYYITRDEMKNLCAKCHSLMAKRKIKRVQVSTIMNRAKFKRVFGVRRSSKGHTGICRRFSNDPKLFKQAVLEKRKEKKVKNG